MSALATPRYAGWLETRYLARKGLWRVRLRYREGTEKPTEAEAFVVADNESEAMERGAEALADARHELTKRVMRTSLPAAQRAQLMTFEQFYETEFVPRRLPQHSSSYQSDVRHNWDANINPYLGGIPLTEFVRRGHEIGREWVTALSANGRRRPTIVKAVNIGRGMLTFAIREGVISPEKGVHPFAYLPLPEKDFEEEIEFALELEQTIAVAWLTPGRLRHTLWLELVADEALRQQEVAPLLWTDLLRENGRPRPTIAVTKAVSGRGRPKEEKGHVGAQIATLKNARQGRRAPELFPALGELVVAVWEDEGSPPLAGRRVFSTAGHLGIQDIDNFRDDFWASALEAAINLDVLEQDGRYGHVTPHRFRGAAASAYGYAPGWNEARLLRHVGHVEMTTTLDWYIRAKENPRPELEAMPIDDQIRRARKRAIDVVERNVARLAGIVAETERELESAKNEQRAKAARSAGARLRIRRRELELAEQKLATLRALVAGEFAEAPAERLAG